MATFKIIGSRRCGLEDCEFDVILEDGEIIVNEIFPIWEKGTLWEFIIRAIEHRSDSITLFCKTWLPESGAFVGLSVKTRAMNAVDRKRYASVLGGQDNG
ncbi:MULTISPECIES: hypothetical protein [unclassified Sphingobium]|uniref:hypothetical protein n=1 Tax=unclassified Sphingobium TaxID=2611147 RepID=UPI002224320F|nr:MULTISPECIES: hypothetical protein [unclassified Sphingobium]MCW2349713.1 hypothetical protein [Sphingobium sp. B12D2B]MCW2368817.1 hypothetical protein [Sphingobium sp. B11D3D]